MEVVLDNEPVESSEKPLLYVGIGASAGGLDALEELLKNMPVDTGMAFIIVQHLSPDYKSMMVELLSQKTKMNVLKIENGMEVLPNTVYLIPPKKNLTIFHSKLLLTDQIRDSRINLPIDIFLQSLAIDQTDKVVGVILSGTGSDGTLGIKSIKEQGGLVIVQELATSKFDGMPKSAIASGFVDYIIPAEKMGSILSEYVKNSASLKNLSMEGEKPGNDYMKILSVVRSNQNLDFSSYKPKTIQRRIEKRIKFNRLNSYQEYIQFLIKSKEESEILAREFLIGVTQFFRDKNAFDVLQEKVIPEIFANKKRNETIRIWSVGCASGEEPYSLALLCYDYMEKNSLMYDLKIFASDLDKEAIKKASLGIYPESIAANVPEPFLEKYFLLKNGSYQIKDSIRQIVVFAAHNIVTDPPFSKISLVVCRNLLIYFNPEMQTKILNLFQYSISNGGYLFLGSSESISNTDNLEVIDSKNKIFKFVEGSRAPFPSQLLLPAFDKEKILAKKEKSQQIVKSTSGRSSESIYESIVNLFAPPGFIINSDDVVVHFFKDIQKYIVLPHGRPTFNIYEILDSQLSTIFSNLIHKVRKDKKEVALRKIIYKLNGTNIIIDIVARLVSLNKNIDEYVVITIEEIDDSLKALEIHSDISFNYDEQLEERLKVLEKEIQFKDESLQTTIEELETSNEELQSTNEELISSNEELQSTNEELQSVNEELYTVNSQYHQKIDELTEMSNDVNNLLKNTKFGYLFLDNNLNIRKFTPEITKLFNIMDMDIGRPFSHISNTLEYKSLIKDMEDVLDSIIEKEIEVHDKNGNWYLLRLHPYRYQDNSIHGVVLTQIDITGLKNVQLHNLKLVEAVENSINGIMITSPAGIIEYVNSKFSEISGYSKGESVGKYPSILQSGYHKIDFYKELWDTILSGKVWSSEMKNRKKNGEFYWEHNTISAIKDKNGKIINFLSIKHDITESKKLNLNLKLSSNTLVKVQELSKTGSWTYQFSKQLFDWSDETYRIFGYEPKSFIPTFENFISIVDLNDREKVKNEFNRAVESKVNYKIIYKITRPSGEIKYIEELVEYNHDLSEYLIGCVKDITEMQLLLDEEKRLNHDLEDLNNKFKMKNQELSYTNSFLIQAIPYPFVYNKILLDNKGEPIDYEFVEVNKAFEEFTGLKKETIIGKNVKTIIPDIEIIWIQKFGKVALTGEPITFEQYSKFAKKTFVSKVFSPQKGFFCGIFIEKGNEENV